MTKNKLVIFAIFIVTVVYALSLMPRYTSPVRADRPPDTHPTYPESPEQPPSPDENGRDSDSESVGAYIELQSLPATMLEGWTVVQWQNEKSDWYDVEGWQGTPDPGGGKRWWVAPKNFGTGPFRWVVTQGKGGPSVGESDPFDLPSEANKTIHITVTVRE